MKHGVSAACGTKITAELVAKLLDEEAEKLAKTSKPKGLKEAKEIFQTILFNKEKEVKDFMSLVAYPYIISNEARVPKSKL
jgi:hypothetical protein